MTGGKILEQIKIQLRNPATQDLKTIYIDIYDNSLSRKWLDALNLILKNKLHLEKNYCWLGFPNSARDGTYILNQINQSIAALNRADIGYQIDDWFDMSNCIDNIPTPDHPSGRNLVGAKFNKLHRYFEDLQGVSGALSPFFQIARPDVRWHIRQLNLLCHEFESWALSYRKVAEAPAWVRPSTLMCWLHAPRFVLEPEDYELFGVDTLSRNFGGVYVGVNKAVGKHHWEVFNDEGGDSKIDQLTTSTMRSQTEAAGDFDIEWGRCPKGHPWQENSLTEFRNWLTSNGFDHTDPNLTIGHPQIGQINLMQSFGTEICENIWDTLNMYLDVWSVSSSTESGIYDYHWNDSGYHQQQINIISRN